MSNKQQTTTSYGRFGVAERIEHLILVLAFVILALTGLPLAFPSALWARHLVILLGGIATVRQMHWLAALVIALGAVYHVVAATYRLFILNVPASLLPTRRDLAYLTALVNHYRGRPSPARHCGRYTVMQKLEYWGTVIGLFIMLVTGTMVARPLLFSRFLPGQFVQTARVAHIGQALLLLLLFVLHFYNTTIRTLNLSMLTGKLSQAQMEPEHALGWAHEEAGEGSGRVSGEAPTGGQWFLLPLAFLLVAALTGALGLLLRPDRQATTVTAPRETLVAYVQATPTPTPLPKPTSTAILVVLTATHPSFSASVYPLLQSRCAVCHGQQGELSMESLKSILRGGKSGPAVIPGRPEASPLLAVPTGGHPGQLTSEELNMIRRWIADGALDN